MIIVAIILALLGGHVALGNIIGCLKATREHGYSCVPFLSLLFCIIAFFLSDGSWGYWLLLPAIIDPGTLMLLLAPIAVVYNWFSPSNDVPP